MRSSLDALRSLNRYVALTLGDEWEVRLSTEKGTFNRPYARVIQIPSVQYIVESFHNVKMQSVYQVMMFPKIGQNADESQMLALQAADQFWVAFASDFQLVGRGRNSRIPLYDYSGIPMTGSDSGALESDRLYNDFMKLEQPPNITPYQDPADETLWSVMANITMSWTRSALLPSTAPTARAITVTYQEGKDDC
jgi:hypothetical protein